MTRKFETPGQFGAGAGVTFESGQPSNKVHSKPKKKSRQQEWRARNPLKTWAHVATASGIRRGLIKPQACEVCGAEKAEAHHDDYHRPLVVTWLCREHHRQVHYPRKGGK